MLKSIRKGARFSAYCPASTAPIGGKELAVECLAERVAPDQAVRFNRDIHDRRP